MTLSPGLMLRGRYRPTHRLAVGGMGEVWCAEDTLLGRSVAIKMVRSEYADDTTFRDRFRNEARHAAVLTHPNVTQVFDFDEGGHGEPPYIVMEYVDGQPLATLLDAHGRMTVQQTWSILGQTAAALDAAHAIGVVHRDVKPGNILVCDDGRVKVTDFGIARATDEAGTTQPGMLMGTARYLAPELFQGEPASPASDLYALGIVAYECLAGHVPFQGDLPALIDAHQHQPPPPLPDTVPPALRDLVMALLAKDPAARPTDAVAVAKQGQRLGGTTTVAGSAPPAAVDPYPTQGYLPPDVASSSEHREHTQVFDDVLEMAGGLVEAPPAERSRSRRAVAIVLGCLGIAALVAAAVLVTIRATGNGKPATSPSHSSSPSPSTTPIRIADLTVFEPDGSGSDHPEELPLATDGSMSSAWYTEHYASAAFGNLKQGVGLLVRVPAKAAVGTVTVRFTQPGLAVKLYAGDSSSSVMRGKPQASTTSAPARWRVRLDQPVKASYWLVWITQLVPDDGGYRAGVADLSFTG